MPSACRCLIDGASFQRFRCCTSPFRGRGRQRSVRLGDSEAIVSLFTYQRHAKDDQHNVVVLTRKGHCCPGHPLPSVLRQSADQGLSS